MFAAHSSIDDNGIDLQNRISMVVSTKGHTITVKKELPCGKFIVVDGMYDVTIPKGEMGGFVDESKAKMERSTSPPTTVYYEDRRDGRVDEVDSYGAWSGM
jgi:hypothetical protein